MSFWLFVVLLVNFGISWFNARSVARSWADSEVIGGWPRFVVWCAAVMSAAGFTWCYLSVLAIGAGATGFLAPKYVGLTLELGYLIIILPVLGSGLGIWMDSLTTAWRRRDCLSIGVAAWNRYAQIHNTYEAVNILPGVFSDLGKRLYGDDDDASGKAKMLVFMLVVVALCGGILTTAAIIRSSGREYSRQVLNDLRSAS